MLQRRLCSWTTQAQFPCLTSYHHPATPLATGGSLLLVHVCFPQLDCHLLEGPNGILVFVLPSISQNPIFFRVPHTGNGNAIHGVFKLRNLKCLPAIRLSPSPSPFRFIFLSYISSYSPPSSSPSLLTSRLQCSLPWMLPLTSQSAQPCLCPGLLKSSMIRLQTFKNFKPTQTRTYNGQQVTCTGSGSCGPSFLLPV